MTTPESRRALRQQALERFFDHPDVEVAAGLREALEQVRDAGKGEAVFITDSLMLVGEAKRLLAAEEGSDV